MTTFLLLLQASIAVVLGLIQFYPELLKNDGRLTKPGKAFVGLCVAILGLAIWRSQVLNNRAADESNRRIDVLFKGLAEVVMTSPRGPVSRVQASDGVVVQISRPSDESLVTASQQVAGRVSNGSDDVWVVVHPVGTSAYWIQPRVNVEADGDWVVTGHFGRESATDSGLAFELMAIVGPYLRVHEGQILDRWPQARFASPLVRLRRR